MKKVILVISFFALISGIVSTNQAFAQYYRILHPGQTTLYQGEYFPVLGMKTDSVSISDGDTLFHLMRNLQQMDVMCFHLEGPSWMGEKIRVKPDGDAVFYNAFQQEIILKTQVQPGQSWTCYQRDGLRIDATFTHYDTVSILGQTDSLKVIALQAFDNSGQAIAHEINNLGIALSKHHGIYKTINFYGFPDTGLGYSAPFLQEFTLCGIDDTPPGVQNITWLQVHDHQPGDELHITEIESMYNYSRHVDEIHRLLERTNFGEAVSYTWERKIKTTLNNYGNQSFTAVMDTISAFYEANPNFDALPGAAYSLAPDHYTQHHLISGTFGPAKIIIYSSNPLVNGYEVLYGDTCFRPIIICGCIPDYEYYPGLGGAYYNCGLGIETNKRELVYYKKNGTEWGTPLDFTVGIGKPELKTGKELVTIFPNPAGDEVRIIFDKLDLPAELTIYDRFGIEHFRSLLSSSDNLISIRKFAAGSYLLRFSTNDKTFTRHLIKK